MTEEKITLGTEYPLNGLLTLPPIHFIAICKCSLKIVAMRIARNDPFCLIHFPLTY